MKKLLLSLLISAVSIAALKAQTVTDTVSIGASYFDQVWYNLDQGNRTTASGTNWDLAFQISGFSAAILANTAYGAELYIYPNGDTADWASLDTAGFNTWEAWHNPSETWDQGAFNLGIDTSNSFDLGWGEYNFITHNVNGDSLFVWKTANGTIYKIWIQSLASGTYNFLVSDYSGSNIDTVALAKNAFQNKNFGYYSINNGILDLEPLSNNWDLHFGKYMEDVGIPYSVTGVRTNMGIEAVKVYPVNNTSTYDSVLAHSYSTDINVIGHDWKSFNLSTFSWEIADSTVYFIKTDTATYWKVVMTGFGGSSNGNFVFEKTRINLSTSLSENQNLSKGVFTVYPNPVSDDMINLVLDLPSQIRTAEVRLINLNGQVVMSEQIQLNQFSTQQVQLPNIESGMYLIQISHEAGTLTNRLIVR